MRFRPYEDGMPNMVDILERQFTGILDHSPDFVEQVTSVKEETYKEIIRIILNYYNLQLMITYDDIPALELFGIARTLYDIFISKFTDYMLDFFVSFIVNNVESIYAYLAADENIKKPKELLAYSNQTYVDQKFMLVHANINQVIYNMACYDIPLNMLLSYFCEPAVADRLNSIIADRGDIYKNYYASFICMIVVFIYAKKEFKNILEVFIRLCL